MNRILCVVILSVFSFSATTVAQQPARQSQPKPAPTPQASKTASPGAITGRVIAEGGHPVAGASVVAFPANMTTDQESMAAAALRPVSTDDDGRFQLSGLPQKAYSLVVMMPGYVVSQDADEKRFVRPGETANIMMVRGGVITGKVTGPQGEPVVGVRVQAIRVRDSEDRPVKPGFSSLTFLMLAVSRIEWKTDDRGVYRIYGLEPGVYHVAAGGRGLIPSMLTSPYYKDAPTYYPSGTVDTASDVTVRAGDEATGIDIRYRTTDAYSISGSIDGPPAYTRGAVSVMLVHRTSGTLAGMTFVIPVAQSKGYIFDGVGEGDYYVTAYASSGTKQSELASSRPRRVTVKGADVTGASLTLVPLGVISGRMVLEPAQGADLKEKCKDQSPFRLDEVVVRARAVNKDDEKEPASLLDIYMSSAPDDKGEITIRHTGPGRHHIDLDLPASLWYVRAITVPGSTPASQRVDVGRNGLNLKSGGRVDGLWITVAEGAAILTGRVVPAKEGTALPARMRVHLVPVEKEAAEDALRYDETVTRGDGGYEFRNLPPGRYWVVVRAIPDEESSESPPPLAWDASGRAGLRFEGEAINSQVELKPCQRLSDFTVRYSPPITRPAKRSGQR